MLELGHAAPSSSAPDVDWAAGVLVADVPAEDPLRYTGPPASLLVLTGIVVQLERLRRELERQSRRVSGIEMVAHNNTVRVLELEDKTRALEDAHARLSQRR